MLYCVAIVAHPDFEPLSPLAERVHVWLAGTSANRARAEAYWRTNPQKSLEQGVTTFEVRSSDSPEEIVLGALGAQQSRAPLGMRWRSTEPRQRLVCARR